MDRRRFHQTGTAASTQDFSEVIFSRPLLGVLGNLAALADSSILR
jgi:hypothetical protein